MAEIKAIDKKSIHQICSGQVILDLSIAIKELVENSLDAGATSIDVKLKEHGLDFIKVCDNGSGVEERNLAGLGKVTLAVSDTLRERLDKKALKHHTSKLKEFSDLENVETFGFRGEALSSLCALCNMTIYTRHVNSSVGYKLEYDHDGAITSQSPIARQCGTTVILKNLFKTLPVRHKELKKNIKKEYSKLLALLSAYCIISTDVKITCSNQSGKSRSGTTLATQVGQSIQQHIAAVYGLKQLQTLIGFQQLEPSVEVCEEYGLKHDVALETAKMYTLSGFVSEPIHGSGRSVPDRQFYFINSRPVELPKLARVLNEVYHFHNRHQFPFVVLNVVTHRDKVDVNVTPDKRQVFVHNEKVLFAIVKTSFIEMYKKYSGNIMTHNNKPISKDFSRLLSKTDSSHSCEKVRENTENKMQSNLINAGIQKVLTPLKKFSESLNSSKNLSLLSLAKFRSPASHKGSSTTPCKRHSSAQLFETYPVVAKQPKIDDYLSDFSKIENVENPKQDCCKSSPDRGSNLGIVRDNDSQNYSSALMSPHAGDEINIVGHCPKTSVDESDALKKGSSELSNKSSNTRPDVSTDEASIAIDDATSTPPGTLGTFSTSQDTSAFSSTKTALSNSSDGDDSAGRLDADHMNQNSLNSCDLVSFVFDSPRNHTQDCEVIHFSMERLKKWSKSRNGPTATNYGNISSFRAQIDPRQNASAEKELTRHLSRESFLNMKPIGQFNLGFVIARLENDLFIIDQHASDEIYNFETLQRSTEIHSLKLVVPQLLQLDPAAHSVLTDNIDVFRKNGFDFNIEVNENNDKESVYMSRVPVSKNWDFGSSDVDELIFMLSDAPHVMCRPSRIRQMFASRACRKSIMIGTALTYHEMTRLIKHMSEITHPWNCPHGRPTMRHLIDLSKIM